MLDLETLWQYIRYKFEAEFSPIAFTTWIASARPLQLTDNTLVVEVASKLHQDYWKQNIIPQITSLLADNLSTKITILVKTVDEPNPLAEAQT